MDETKEALEAEFERAKTKLNALDGFVGALQAQARYAGAYQALVKAGYRLQVKKKYRRGV